MVEVIVCLSPMHPLRWHTVLICCVTNGVCLDCLFKLISAIHCFLFLKLINILWDLTFLPLLIILWTCGFFYQCFIIHYLDCLFWYSSLQEPLQAVLYVPLWSNHFLNTYLLCMCAKLLWLCLTFCNPMDCSPPGSSIHGFLQARILEWL